MKTANDIQVGDVIIYEAFGGERREVEITQVYEDVKNGRPGFDGFRHDNLQPIWGYCDQIVKYVSHSTQEAK
jgi:hypothetical protein